MTTILSVENLSYLYPQNPRVFFQNLSFDLAAGEVLMILGQNGTGKSTLVDILSGALDPSFGRVQLNHDNLSAYSSKEISQHIAVLHQKMASNLFLDLTLEENWKIWKWRFPYLTLSYEDLLKNSQLPHQEKWFSLREKKLTNLSGGEQQLFGALLLKHSTASLWILDEYTSQLDVHHTQVVMEYLFSEKSRHQRAIIMISHDLKLALDYADSLIILHYNKSPTKISRSSLDWTEQGLRNIMI